MTIAQGQLSKQLPQFLGQLPFFKCPEKGIVNFEQEFIVFTTAIVYEVTDKCLISGRAFALCMC